MKRIELLIFISLLTVNYSIMAQSTVEVAPLQETYKQNPFTLVYAGAITENVKVKGAKNIHISHHRAQQS